ncbi:FAST kinase domain-containing protein 4 isoform X2 [Augochlora pura]
MLQFNNNICTISTRFAPRLYGRITALFATSSTLATQESRTAVKQTCVPVINGLSDEQQENFNKLKVSIYNSLRTDTRIASKIKASNNIHELLELIKLPHLSENEILKVMDSIIKWVNKNNVNTNNRQMQSSNLKTNNNNTPILKTEVKANTDPASKYYELSTASMIKEVLKLAKTKQRNPKELKFLFHNISEYHQNLTVAHISTIMFSMASLSYFDEPFLDKMSLQLTESITTVKSSAVKSILRSMSILKYKNRTFLSFICKLLNECEEDLDCKFVFNIIQSLAILGEQSEKVDMLIQKYEPKLTLDLLGVDNWLNYVWCLVMLNNASHSHVESVLNNQFITTLFSGAERNFLQEIRLLNINGAAKYILQNYHGPLLNEEIVKYEATPHSSEKLLYIDALKETLGAILPSPNSFTMNVNTKMGFFLDAECYVDSKFNLISEDNTAKQPNKLAILIHDYHSYCHGKEDVHGIIKLHEKLLKHSGYIVLPISYKQFGIEDKLTKREQFLKHRIQQLSSL